MFLKFYSRIPFHHIVYIPVIRRAVPDETESQRLVEISSRPPPIGVANQRLWSIYPFEMLQELSGRSWYMVSQFAAEAQHLPFMRLVEPALAEGHQRDKLVFEIQTKSDFRSDSSLYMRTILKLCRFR